MKLPTIAELCGDIESFENLEEIILMHPAIDVKFILRFDKKINFDKLKELYHELHAKGKLKPTSYEVVRMIERELKIEIA